MGKLLKFLIALLLVAGGLVIAVLAGWNYLNSSPGIAEEQTVLYEVREGATVSSIAQELEKGEIIRSSHFFILLSKLYNTQDKVKSGFYRIEPGTTSSEVHDMFVEGSQKLVRVTIPEGLTARKTGARFEKSNICSQDDFLKAVHSAQIIEEYSVPSDTLEGYLFPDTYMFQQKYPAEKVVRHMVDTFFMELGEIEPDYEDFTPAELQEKVVMASIIEREYRDPEEVGRIASVFYNRLEMNMRLQSCATVVYALTEEKGREHPSSLTYDDLEVESDFNTYRNWGMPPGPISNPGKFALAGAMHPADTDFLYFLLKDPNAGKHVFSQTLKDHNTAYRLYIKK